MKTNRRSIDAMSICFSSEDSSKVRVVKKINLKVGDYIFITIFNRLCSKAFDECFFKNNFFSEKKIKKVLIHGKTITIFSAIWSILALSQ
jgi:hypothetical protein